MRAISVCCLALLFFIPSCTMPKWGNVTRDQYDLFIDSYDKNGDKKLDFFEFSKSYATAGLYGAPPVPQSVMKEVFNSTDLNKDGFITADEMRKSGKSFKK